MNLEILYNKKPYKDVFCMVHEYQKLIESLEVCRINYEVVSKREIDGMKNIKINIEDVSTVGNYFY